MVVAMNDAKGESVISRWNRLKAEAREKAAPQSSQLVERISVVAPVGAGGTSHPPVADERSALKSGNPAAGSTQDEIGRQPALLTEADFADVDFEALNFQSDYKRFMAPGVPAHIRNRALRKLWVSDPVLANLDGLDDYIDDYTDAAVAVPTGLLKTAHKIGRGFLSDDEVAEWERLGKPPETAAKAGDSEQVAAVAPGELTVADKVEGHRAEGEASTPPTGSDCTASAEVARGRDVKHDGSPKG